MVVTLTTAVKDWLAINAGIGNCFSHTGISYQDPEGVSHIGSTGDVVNAFRAAFMVDLTTSKIIADMDYVGIKDLNGGVNLTMGTNTPGVIDGDVKWAYANDGATPGISAYCYVSPANVISTTLTVDKTDCVAPCTVDGTVSWTNSGGTVSTATDLGITVNETLTILNPGTIVNPGATTPVYSFSLASLAAGTYVICASPDSGTTCQIVTVRTPANVISTTLTVDKTDCVESCTINGTVSWTNSGDTASAATDLGITVNEILTILSPGTVIDPGATTLSYPFSIVRNAGTYVICASPDSGTTCQIVTVRTPANIVSTTLTLDKTSCTEPCNVTGSVSWRNDGGTTGTLTPAILINDVSMSLGSIENIDPGQTITHEFSLPADLPAGTYIVCASPGTHCQTVVVYLTPADVVSATLTVDKNDCTTPCTVSGTVSWTNNGGTASVAMNLGIIVNDAFVALGTEIVIEPGATTSEYAFFLENLSANTYEIYASPGIHHQTVTVRTPANITTTGITLTPSTCTEPCNVSIDVTYMNSGQTEGVFTPEITIDDVYTPLASETLAAGTSVVKTFELTDRTVGTYTICAVPLGSTSCQTLTVTIPPPAEAGMGELLIAGLAVGALLMSQATIKR